MSDLKIKSNDFSSRFTRHNLLRVYPKSTWMTSSNYDPFVGWMQGAQMAAFKMQYKCASNKAGLNPISGSCDVLKHARKVVYEFPVLVLAQSIFFVKRE
ncbi:hypothetical protein POTOM_001959 [Populus tomentosa]|uniref:PI-PLC Y-box domain-containing protein n=1 Tax=Populus tomentosa TaxID=118781 RepID=A0A8X8DIX6_POPTO|nr:hypothetical protein POTOM_001959 [Populus tomentosa]